jgi:hypothetical protein
LPSCKLSASTAFPAQERGWIVDTSQGSPSVHASRRFRVVYARSVAPSPLATFTRDYQAVKLMAAGTRGVKWQIYFS